MNFMWNKISIDKKKIRIILCIFLILIYILGTYFVYDEYRDTIIAKQQENMLGITRSICRSIDLYINSIVDSMEAIVGDKDFIDGISQMAKGVESKKVTDEFESYYISKGEIVDRVYFIDAEGDMLIKYPSHSGDIYSQNSYDINIALNTKKTHVGRAHLDEDSSMFILNIYQPVFEEEKFKGVIAVSLSLDVIYDILVAPAKVGEKGYVMIKDQDGIIIMHPVKEQVGMDVIETRKEVFPGLEYQELERLVKNQLTGKEGTEIYHSYWWGDNVLKKTKKLNAYTPVKFGDYFWVVALTTSYGEIAAPINKFLMKIIGSSIIVAIVIAMFLAALLSMKKNKEDLEKETNYLKKLNESSEKLRKQEAEIYHSHKLKMIGTLAGGIAHDINNLLTPILGYSELLLMRFPKGSESYQDIEEIFKASQKGKEMIQQMLVFARNDNNIIKVESININNSLREAIRMLKVLLPKNILIEEKIKENCGFIHINYSQIHQVIFNLCINAYQSIKDNRGTIEISLDNVMGILANKINNTLSVNKNYLELTIKDSGCGMDEETKRRIFEPFFTTKIIGDGTGLGLFVVQSIVDEYEGIIMVESEQGQGSTFKVYLPLDDNHNNIMIEDKVTSTDINHKIKRILIVDDNEKVIKVLKKGLQHLGYIVVTQTDPSKALKIFSDEYSKFDLVITDYIMPNIKGNQLAKEVRNIRNDIPIILITGYMDSKEVEYINAYVSKPIELANLAKVIKELK